MRYFIELSYDGTNYKGWQRQQNANSVQEHIEQELATLLRQDIELVGCGRTDSGVHAHQYFAHFNYEHVLPENIIYRLNSLLGTTIAIKRIFEVPENLHARFDAVQRTYKYFLHQEKNPFLVSISFQTNYAIDIPLMNEIAAQLIGTHDCSSFEKKGSDNQNSICTITEAQWNTTADGWVFTISANRFLRNMVRAITASLLMVGNKQIDVKEWLRLFTTQQTIPLKIVVPAKGLFLWEITYPNT